MDKIIGLHNIARKYCIDRINTLSRENMIWCNKILSIYEKTGDYNCDEINNLNDEYPDINIHEDILKFMLEEIERIIPENYTDENKLREDIVKACKNSNIRNYMHYSNRDDKIKKVISDEEKLKLNTFINSLNEKELCEAEPLFYRRVLSEQTCENELKFIEEIWDVFDESREDIIVFNSNCFLENFKDKFNINLFRKVLIDHGIKKIIEIELYGKYTTTAREIEVSAFEFNPFHEGYWFSEKKDWVIFKWHEDRCFVGGKWLVDYFQNGWFNWDEEE